MADKFLQSTGIESGYFAKRKSQFNDEIAKGLKFSTAQPSSVKSKKKFSSNESKPISKPKAGAKKDISKIPPNQLTGQDFVERMRLAREAKAKENNQNA